MRWLGSKTSILSSKSIAEGGIFRNLAAKCCFGYRGSCLTYLLALSLRRKPRLELSGEPTSCIFNKWGCFFRQGGKKNWCLFYLCDKPKLMNIVFARKQRLSRHDFAEYATSRPYIDSCGVLWAVKKQLRSSVPTCDDIFSHEVCVWSCSRKPLNRQSWALCFELSSTLLGLRSRCNMLAECTYLSLLTSWYTMNCKKEAK